MTSSMSVYHCDVCDQEGIGASLPNGWWSYPPGWFVMETERTSAAVCSEKCALAWDAKDAPTPVLDIKVADIGGALVAGLFAGAALRGSMDLIGNALAKMPCRRCGRTLPEHAKEPDEKCAGFEGKKFDPATFYVYGERVRATHDIHYTVSRDDPSGWVQVAEYTSFGFTIRKGTLGTIVQATVRGAVVRWDKSQHDLDTTLRSIEKAKEESDAPPA